jgi:cystathionine beta-lyase/cystathionine gamma-synthase
MALMPPGGTLLYGSDVYYECELAFRRHAAERGWTLMRRESVEQALRGGDTADVVYVDSPSNWLLRTYDLAMLADVAHEKGAFLIVDVTLQPCQPALCHGVDVVVCSLSKDASLGCTTAGGVASRDRRLLERIDAVARADGSIVTPDTAHAIHLQVRSLRDRLTAQTSKVNMIAQMLREAPSVRRVRVADATRAGGMTGSQLSFHLRDVDHGTALEKVVGHRALDPSMTLNLACTFGTVFTTIEHFFSNPRDRGHSGETENENAIPPDLVRLGVGCEDGDRIIDDLRFALAASKATRP